MPLFVLMMVLMTSVFLFSLQRAKLLRQKIDTQIAVDLTAISLSRIQARSLNGLAILNQQLRRIHVLAKSIIVSWAAVSTCAAACTIGVGCACVPIAARYAKSAPKILKTLRKTAERIARTQDQIIKDAPIRSDAIARRIAKKNRIEITRVGCPRGNNDESWNHGSNRPLLRVRREGASDLNDIKHCQKRNLPQGGQVPVCRTSSDLLGKKYKLPAPLILEGQFHRLQKIQIFARSLASNDVTAKAQATVTTDTTNDSSLTKMNWDAKLEAVSF